MFLIQYKKHILVFIAVLFLLFFTLITFHAYAFTHPVSSNFVNIERDGMQMSLSNKVKIAFTGIYPIRHITTQTTTDVGLEYENVSFSSKDGLRLYGWFMPARHAIGTVIIGHGYNANRGDIRFASFLHNASYNVLMFDFRGHGMSDGDYISMGWYEKNDIIGAVNYLKTRNDVDPDKIYGLGFSMGAAAMVFAQEEKSVFNALALESLYPSLYTSTHRRFQTIYGLPKFPFATAMTLVGGAVLDLNGFDVTPAKSLEKIDIPVLLIHDSKDDTLKVEDAMLLNASVNNGSLWIVEGGKHSAGYGIAPEEYEKRVVGLFGEN